MRKLSTLLVAPVLSAVFVLAACGDSKPPKSPETVAPNSGPESSEDMPPPPAKDGEPGAGGDKAPAGDKAAAGDKGGPAGGALKVAAMKFTPTKKGGKAKSLEVKADGTVALDGKPVARLSGDQLDSTVGDGTLVTVGIDGSLVGSAVKPGFKFDGDDLTIDGGGKASVGDDGTLTLTGKDGKAETLGKWEGGDKAKRAAIVVTFAMFMPKDAAAKPGAKPAAPPKK